MSTQFLLLCRAVACSYNMEFAPISYVRDLQLDLVQRTTGPFQCFSSVSANAKHVYIIVTGLTDVACLTGCELHSPDSSFHGYGSLNVIPLDEQLHHATNPCRSLILTSNVSVNFNLHSAMQL